MAVRVSLRVVLLTLFIVSSVTIGIVAFVPTLLVGQRGVEDTAQQLRLALQAQVNDMMRRYVVGIQLANDQYYEAFQLGVLDPFEDQLKTIQGLCATLKATPDLVFSQIGTEEQGHFFGCEKTPLEGGGATYVSWIRNSSNWGACDLYNVDNETFHETSYIRPLTGYDPRLRGWYTRNLPSQAWTAPYLWASGRVVGITAGRPIFYPNGTRFGVYAVDVVIDTVSSFLRQINFGPNGNAFIVDRNTGELVGVSWSGEGIMMNVTGGSVNAWQIELKRAQNLELAQARRVVGKLGGSSATLLAFPTGLYDDGDDWVSVNDLDDPYGLRWRIVVTLDRRDYLGDFLKNRTTIIVCVVCVILVMLAAQVVLSHTLLQSLTELTKRMQEMNAKTLTTNEPASDLYDGEHEEMEAKEQPVESYSRLGEVAVMQQSFAQMSTTIMSFSRYVPKEVVCDLLYKGELARVGVEPAHCTVLFCDIAKFTTISQRCAPEELAQMMEKYYDAQTKVINNHGGVIDKFIGDAIMVCWGAPIEIDNQNVRACATGVNMLAEVQSEKLQQAFAPSGIELGIRVGISSGVVLAGNMGGATRLNYTLIGDAVNLAARLESLNKQFGTRLLISEDMVEDVQDVFVTRLLGHMQVAGFERATLVFEVVGLVPEFGDVTKANTKIQTAANRDHSASSLPTVRTQRTQHTVKSGSTLYAQPKQISAEAKAMRARRLAAVYGVEEILKAAKERTHICTEVEATFCRFYSTAVRSFLGGGFNKAIVALKECNKTFPAWESKTALLLEQCQKLDAEGAPADFSGTIELSNK
eukprot:CAMPEP_0174828666 /NCGR_PEP_ID=MMETSP1114-20130205/1474_1 /TAXON_ID=312471 /ORGANISM="Neobodo designis, Strain CCAP 1951/1" /LENGTH=807 /DNA_ID=CAMNT_0016062389 /DNA_START=154 /DNA_END=2577 /DNA_ORIENTATION=-